MSLRDIARAVWAKAKVVFNNRKLRLPAYNCREGRMREVTRLCCVECNWHGVHSELLTGQNPFDPSETIDGCPNCKCIDSVESVCDEPGCWQPPTCGTQTKSGYRSTCRKHRP